jgi:hypothetical protein
VALALIFFVFAGVNVLIGYGLWNLRSWAATIAFGLSTLAAACSVAGVISGLLHFSIFRLLFWAVCLAINCLILWYLRQPEVKQTFGTGRMPAGMSSPTY